MGGARSKRMAVRPAVDGGRLLRIHSFPPISAADARVLILGSMPGKASLAANQYYAHPQNRFWMIMGELIDAGWDKPYDRRLERLIAHRIALWDVLHSCTRTSSLDSDIDDSTIVPNDIVRLLETHPEITRVYFNGHKAEQTFQKHLRTDAGRIERGIAYTRLPSTSPANASMPYREKLARWRAVVEE